MSMMPQNAFVVNGSKPVDGCDTVTQHGNVGIRQNPFSEAGRLRVLESEHYTLLLRGHFYSDAAATLEAGENLGLLLQEMMTRGSFAKALPIITGGLYALFVIDRRTGAIQAVVDRTGSMPIYFRDHAGRTEFSNNQFVFGAATSELAMCEFLKYGYLPFSESLFEGVQRIGPGEIVSWEPDRSAVRNQVFASSFTYLPPDQRIQKPEEAAERLATIFDRYFSRLGSGHGVSGLSGGYDSRLIAAYCAEKDVEFFNFGHPYSREVQMAQRVANRLEQPLLSFSIPDDAIAQHGDRFSSAMSSLDSFEDAHILEMIDRAIEAKAAYAMDGFFGDSVLGSNYFYKLALGIRAMFPGRHSILYETALHPSVDYVDKFYENKRAVPDAELRGLMTGEFREAIRAIAAPIVESHRAKCPTHEDLSESLTYTFRASRLIAGGPVAIGSATLCACPFMDRDVFETAMNCAKQVRAGDRLYNAFWRHRFPKLADIPKSNTGGHAASSDWRYRLTHLQTAIQRRAINPGLKRLTGGLWDRTESYSSTKTYMANAANVKYMQSLAARNASRLPQRIADALISEFTAGTLHPLVSLRLATLLACLG